MTDIEHLPPGDPLWRAIRRLRAFQPDDYHIEDREELKTITSKVLTELTYALGPLLRDNLSNSHLGDSLMESLNDTRRWIETEIDCEIEELQNAPPSRQFTL